MTKTIEQSIRFNASAKELHAIYMDTAKHAAMTGAPVQISSKPGSKFKAFDGLLWGQTIAVVPGKMIVQRWRSCNFKATDPDSILVLNFVQDGKRGRIDLAHVNVPKQDHAGVTRGWKKYYWGPMKNYLTGRKGR
jgi:activator of HSP90 ATPase